MIAASVLGSGIAAIDATVVAIALPAIGHDLNAGVAALQRVVTGYLPQLGVIPAAGRLLGSASA